MKLSLDHNTQAVQAALNKAASQVPYALSVALNKTAAEAKTMVQAEMQSVFDRPTPWVLNSLRIKYAKKSHLVAELAFKDKNSVESSRSMVEPHVDGGGRRFKAMETRLFMSKRKYLPKGWHAVPGAAASLDANGNMSRGQISQLLNVLGTYEEAGYNKANDKTRKRLAAGNMKRNQYGYEYFVNPVGGKRRHLQPGVSKRFRTPFGSSLKPILIFVRTARYQKRLDFFGLVERKVNERLAPNFDEAFKVAVATAFFRNQGALL
jgi:hypothetical protein